MVDHSIIQTIYLGEYTMAEQIQIVDNGETVVIDVRDIHYNGLRGNVPDYTLTKHISGDRERSVSVTVNVTVETVNHYVEQTLVEQLKRNHETTNLKELIFDKDK